MPMFCRHRAEEEGFYSIQKVVVQLHLLQRFPQLQSKRKSTVDDILNSRHIIYLFIAGDAVAHKSPRNSKSTADGMLIRS
jgi:hypothetical protein